VLKSGAIYFLGRAGAAFITLLSVAVYTRLLSPGEYGVYTLVMSGALMAYVGMMHWLTSALARFLPAYQDREDFLLSHVAMAYGAIALFILAGACVLVPWLAPAGDTRTALALGVGLFLTLSFAELNLVVFQMRGEAYRYAKLAFLRVAAAAAIGIALAYLGWGSIGLLAGAVAGHLCIVLSSLSAWGSARYTLVRRGFFRELAAYGFPLAVSGALGAFIHASDRYIISILIGTDAAGLYAAPYDVAMRSLHVLMLVIAMAGNPLVYRAFEAGGEAAARPLMRRQAELLLGVGLPASIAFALLAPTIAHVFLGEAFQATARALIPWIAIATLAQGLQSFYVGLAFALPKMPLRQTYVFALGAVTNLVLNLLLIPPLGLIGAALATVAAYLLILIGSFLTGRSLFTLPLPLAGLAKILAASVVWTLILWPVRDTTALAPVLLHGLIAAVTYLTMICALDVAGTRHLLIRVAQLAFGRLRPPRSG
jgi:O-antigen/teichoic acid export membrane protein